MNTQHVNSVQQQSSGNNIIDTGSLLSQVSGGLVLILFIFVIGAWISKRCKLFSSKLQGEDFFTVKRNQVLGQQGRLIVVEFNDKWLLLGVSSENIGCLATMDKPAATEVSAKLPDAYTFQKIIKNSLTLKKNGGSDRDV